LRGENWRIDCTWDCLLSAELKMRSKRRKSRRGKRVSWQRQGFAETGS